MAEAARGGHSQPLLVGAFARDVWFWHVHGIETARATEDIDITMEFPDWDGFTRFGGVLLDLGFTQPVPGHPEKLLDPQTGQKLDLLPFGRLSTDGRSIIWPADQTRWSIVGFEESFRSAASLSVGAEAAVHIRIATLPAMVLLKMVAFYERPLDRRRKDGSDIGFTLDNYLGAGNAGRLEDGRDVAIMDEVGGDLQRASASLLGRDMGRLAGEATRGQIMDHMRQEVESPSRCPLTRELSHGIARGDFRRARVLMRDLLAGIVEGADA